MRVKRLAAAAAAMAMVLVATGCLNDRPPITEEQLADWKELAEQTIPAATDVTIEVREATTMAGSGQWIEVAATFADFEDLKATKRAMVEFDRTVAKQSRGVLEDTTAINADAAAHEADLGAAVVRQVPGLAGATVVESGYRLQSDSRWVVSANILLYVQDLSAIDPSWLD